MATRYVEVPREAFEQFFADANAKLEANKHAVRWRPCEVLGELTYDIEVAREPDHGLVKLVVYTSVGWGQDRVRLCGKDAIRTALVFCDAHGHRHGISTETKVLRTGSPAAVIERLKERIAEAWQKGRHLKCCRKCGAPAYQDSGRCVVRACREAREAS